VPEHKTTGTTDRAHKARIGQASAHQNTASREPQGSERVALSRKGGSDGGAAAAAAAQAQTRRTTATSVPATRPLGRALTQAAQASSRRPRPVPTLDATEAHFGRPFRFSAVREQRLQHGRSPVKFSASRAHVHPRACAGCLKRSSVSYTPVNRNALPFDKPNRPQDRGCILAQRGYQRLLAHGAHVHSVSTQVDSTVFGGWSAKIAVPLCKNLPKQRHARELTAAAEGYAPPQPT